MSDPMEPTGPALTEQLGALTTGLHGWLAGLDPARVYAAPAEGEWSVMELFAHMTEFLGYWSDAAAAIAAAPGVSFGRTIDDGDRTGFVEAHREDPVEVMLAAFSAAAGHARAQLASIPDAGWSAVGVHVRLGEMTLPDMVSGHLIRHLAGHWEQAKASYAAVAGV